MFQLDLFATLACLEFRTNNVMAGRISDDPFDHDDYDGHDHDKADVCLIAFHFTECVMGRKKSLAYMRQVWP
jgi:hypothetical protein